MAYTMEVLESFIADRVTFDADQAVWSNKEYRKALYDRDETTIVVLEAGEEFVPTCFPADAHDFAVVGETPIVGRRFRVVETCGVCRTQRHSVQREAQPADGPYDEWLEWDLPVRERGLA